jgi:hypothetical protein
MGQERHRKDSWMDNYPKSTRLKKLLVISIAFSITFMGHPCRSQQVFNIEMSDQA